MVGDTPVNTPPPRPPVLLEPTDDGDTIRPPMTGVPTPADHSVLISVLADIIAATCVVRVVQSPNRSITQEDAA